MKTNLSCLAFALAALVGALFAADSTPTPLSPNAEQSTIITATRSKIVRGDKETVITYDGSVTVSGTNLRILCDHLEVVLFRLGDKSESLSTLDKFKSLVATGHVHVTQGDREASCGRTEVLPGEDKIVLTEDPIVTLQDREGKPVVLKGSRITYHRGKGEIEVEQVVTTGPSFKDLGANPADLKPAPTAPVKQP
jgi:lipopolysaccharide export system protein LptA